MPRKAMRDVVVCLPGVAGSVLQRNGKDVWNVSGGAALGALLSLGQDVNELKLEDDPSDVDDLGDGVEATAVLREVHLLPGLWKVDGYTKLVEHIEKTFDVQHGRNLFEFPYDWRRDNRVAARRLQRESAGWLKAWRERSGAADAKLILVGHSMGGLVSRYFLECLDGWRDTRMLVSIGTPYRGSMNAVSTLVNGMKMGPLDLTGLARTLTAIHQLLPIYPCYDAGDGKLARLTEATVPQLDAAKVAAARTFHDEIRDAVDEHLKDDGYLAGRYDIRPVIGIDQPTSQSCVRNGEGVQLLKRYEQDDMGGDGTVPRVSATPIEVENEANAMYANERHSSLQNDDPVLVQLTGALSGIKIDHERFKGAVPTIGLSLDIDDVYGAGEPIPVRVRPESESPDAIVAVAEDVETGEERTRETLRPADDDWLAAELGPLPQGVYRVTAFGSGMVEPVTDLVAVLADA